MSEAERNIAKGRTDGNSGLSSLLGKGSNLFGQQSNKKPYEFRKFYPKENYVEPGVSGNWLANYFGELSGQRKKRLDTLNTSGLYSQNYSNNNVQNYEPLTYENYLKNIS